MPYASLRARREPLIRYVKGHGFADPTAATQIGVMVQFDEGRLAQVCREYGVERLRLFGSAARGEERPDSDVDLIADFREGVGFFALVELEDRLSELFGRQVDLLTEGGISPYMKDSILSEATLLFDEE